MEESIPELMYTMMSLLFLLLGVVLIASIVMSLINPYDQVTFANVEKLRAAMNQACATGSDVNIKFSLPQNTPSHTGLFQVLPIWLINTNGDPNYVLYYESFPPGEAVGWEVYQNLQNRIVAYLPDGSDGKTQADVLDYAKSVIDKAKKKGVGIVEGVVIGNIVINDKRSDFYVGEQAGGVQASTNAWQERAKEDAKKYGSWNNKVEGSEDPAPGDNYFKFSNYVTLNSFEKSAIKYESCGENSLCLKTRTGVYRFPLDQCKGIQNVQLIYDETAIGGTEKVLKNIGLGTVEFTGSSIVKLIFSKLGSIGQILTVASFFKNTIAYEAGARVGDFTISSPCDVQDVIVQKSACDKFSYDRSTYIDSPYNPCENSAHYTLYQYGNDDKLHDAGSRDVCVERIGTTLDDVQYSSQTDKTCLRVFVRTKNSGYCWTPDPYKKTTVSGFFFDHQQFISALSDLVGLTPVKDSTAIINQGNSIGDTIVLFPTDVALQKGQGFFESLGRKYWWGWPG